MTKNGISIRKLASLQLEPFGLILETVSAGYHDGQRISIDIRNLTDPVVSYHERIHQKIFTGTPDGQVLSALLQLLMIKRQAGDRKPRKSRPVPTAVAKLAKLLLANSRFAHEAAATYTSIVRFTPGPGVTAYDRLPERYQVYYRSFADLLDHQIDSAFHRRLVVRAIWTVVFSSNYLARFVESTVEKPPKPTADDLPDERYKRLLSTLQSADLRDLNAMLNQTVERCMREVLKRGDDPKDTRIEDILEEAMIPAIMGYIYPRYLRQASLPLLSIDNSTLLKRMADLVKPYNFTIMVAEASPQAAIRTQAFWQGNSMFVNSGRRTCEPGDDRDLQGDATLDSLAEYQILSVEPPDHFRRWMFLGYPIGRSNPSGAYYSPAAIGDWLVRCTARERANQRFPLARAITVAAQTIEEIVDIQSSLMTRVGIPYGTDRIRGCSAAVVVCYWYSGWPELLTRLGGMGPLRTMTIRMVKAETGDNELEAAVMLKIIMSPQLAGYILRVLSVDAAEDMKWLERPLYDSGQLLPIDEARAASASRAARNSFQLIMDYWSSY